MIHKNITRALPLMILTISLFTGLPSFAQENEEGMAELVAGITAELDLSEKQVAQMQSLLVQYQGKMNGILLKYEDEEEPDVGAMIGEIRDARDAYRNDLQGILSKEQYEKYEAMMQSILTGMFNDLAAIRLMDVQPVAELTDGQVESLIPIVGKSMMQTVQLLFENAGTRLSVPTKVSISKSLKSIEKEKREGLERILTPDQLRLYDQYKEEQKAKK